MEYLGVFCCLLIIDFFAMFVSPYFLKGMPSARSSSLASSSVFAVVTMQMSIPLIVGDFGEDQLFLDAYGIVSAAVERLVGHALEVSHTGKRDGDELIVEVEHSLAPQGHLDADRLSLSHFEVGDGFLRLRHDGLLARNELDFVFRRLHRLRVVFDVAESRVDYDFNEPGALHHGSVAELFHEERYNFFLVLFFYSVFLLLSVTVKCVIKETIPLTITRM